MIEVLIILVLILLILVSSNLHKKWVEGITEDSNRLVKEQIKLLQEIKTQLLILNAKIDKNSEK